MLPDAQEPPPKVGKKPWAASPRDSASCPTSFSHSIWLRPARSRSEVRARARGGSQDTPSRPRASGKSDPGPEIGALGDPHKGAEGSPGGLKEEARQMSGCPLFG